MATTVVRKGAGRAAHNERVNRHAQRTPLPPKGGGPKGNPTVEALKDELARSKAKAAEKRPGEAKATDVAEFARRSGWDVKVEWHGETVEITATRSTPVGDEECVVTFARGVIARDAQPTRRLAGREWNLRNITATKRDCLAVEPDKVVLPNRPGRPKTKPDSKRSVNGIATRSELPDFAPLFASDATDEEVLATVVGHVIVWRNGLGGFRDEDAVPRESKGTRITTATSGARILEFTSANGFRAVRVPSIERVK